MSKFCCFFLSMQLAFPNVGSSLTRNSDYDVFLSPLDDFKKEVQKAGLTDKLVYLDRKDEYRFKVKGV